MKIIAASLLFFSTLVMAQIDVTDEYGNKTLITKEDSFVIYSEKNGDKYIGISAYPITGKFKSSQFINYKILRQDCESDGQFKVLMVNDSDSKILFTSIVTFNEHNRESAVAKVICDYAKKVESNPEINQYSLQNVQNHAQRAPDSQWSEDMPLEENTMAALNSSLRFEHKNVSMIIRLRFPARTTEYFKLYIDRDLCRKRSGEFEMKTITGEEMQNVPFSLDNTPTNQEDLNFHKIAKTMCTYSMTANVFKKSNVKTETRSITSDKK